MWLPRKRAIILDVGGPTGPPWDFNPKQMAHEFVWPIATDSPSASTAAALQGRRAAFYMQPMRLESSAISSKYKVNGEPPKLIQPSPRLVGANGDRGVH